MVPEKKLLLAFVTADFRPAPCAPVSPEFQLAKLVGIKVNLNLQVDGGGAGTESCQSGGKSWSGEVGGQTRNVLRLWGQLLPAESTLK